MLLGKSKQTEEVMNLVCMSNSDFHLFDKSSQGIARLCPGIFHKNALSEYFISLWLAIKKVDESYDTFLS